MNELHRPQFLPDLLIAALERNADRPCLLIANRVLTASEVRDEISRYAQSYRARGIVRGEILISMGATMVTGCRATPLHPTNPDDACSELTSLRPNPHSPWS